MQGGQATERYWPFPVLPLEERTLEDQAQIDFLEAAYRDSFRPLVFGVENFAAAAGPRAASIIRRGRRWWELRAGSASEGWLSAYVAGFDANAAAALRWLRGATLAEVLDVVRPHLVHAGSRALGYVIDPPVSAETPNHPRAPDRGGE
jgi:hypothetical protein